MKLSQCTALFIRFGINWITEALLCRWNYCGWLNFPVVKITLQFLVDLLTCPISHRILTWIIHEKSDTRNDSQIRARKIKTYCFCFSYVVAFAFQAVLWRYKFSQLKGSSDDGKSKIKFLFQNQDSKSIEAKVIKFDRCLMLHARK